MKKLLFIAFAFVFGLFNTTFGQETIWTEDFESYTDDSGITGIGNSGDYPASVSKWSLDVSSADLQDVNDWFMVHEVSSNKNLEGQDTGGEAIWTSELIDISQYANVSIDMDIKEVGDHEATDYLKVYYSINGGTETLFETNGDNSDDFGELQVSQTGLNAANLQIIVKMKNNAASEKLRLDNIIIKGIIEYSSDLVVRLGWHT